MAGYDRAYTFINKPVDKRRKLETTEGLTLYEGCKLLVAAAKADRLHDITGVYRMTMGRRRAVAFFSEWTGVVTPFFSALPYERTQIGEDKTALTS